MQARSPGHVANRTERTDGAPLTRALGKTLRDLRRSRGLSLAEVAEGTNLSTSFLSLVENGKSDISISRLMRVAQFYDVSVAELLKEDPKTSASSVVVRMDQRQRISSPGEGIDILLLTADTRRVMMPVLLEYEPEGGYEEAAQHDGEELVFVLEGELEIQLRTEIYTLYPGDCAYFQSEIPHAFRNVAPGKTVALGVLTPPVW